MSAFVLTREIRAHLPWSKQLTVVQTYQFQPAVSSFWVKLHCQSQKTLVEEVVLGRYSLKNTRIDQKAEEDARLLACSKTSQNGCQTQLMISVCLPTNTRGLQSSMNTAVDVVVINKIIRVATSSRTLKAQSHRLPVRALSQAIYFSRIERPVHP